MTNLLSNDRLLSVVSIAGVLAVLTIQFFALTANRDEILVDNEVYFVDADCYSRMTRVVSILEGGEWSIRKHGFENWPTGTQPHTTLPMDFLIIGLVKVLPMMGVDSARAVDLAGAWVSPILGMTLILLLGVWSRWMRLRFGWMMIIIVAISPIIVQAFKFGRPDHQSLLMLLLAGGVALEAMLWRCPRRGIAVLWGLAWAMALWVSLYEPLILFSFLFLLRIIVFRREAFSKNWLLAGVVFAVFYSITITVDGWRIWPDADPAIAEFFPRWATMLGELASVPVFSKTWMAWGGWGILLLPVFLILNVIRIRDRMSWLWLALVALTFGLAIWQIRWASYFILFAAMAIPFALNDVRIKAGWIWAGFFIALWPIAEAWERILFPDETAIRRMTEQRAENSELKTLAGIMRTEGSGRGFLAPWWISPAVAYWSGQSGIAGSSHQSLSGIADAARFYLTTNSSQAKDILKSRRVEWVIIDDPSRTLSTSAILLNEPGFETSSGKILAEKNTDGNQLGLACTKTGIFFQLYRVLDEDHH